MTEEQILASIEELNKNINEHLKILDDKDKKRFLDDSLPFIEYIELSLKTEALTLHLDKPIDQRDDLATLNNRINELIISLKGKHSNLVGEQIRAKTQKNKPKLIFSAEAKKNTISPKILESLMSALKEFLTKINKSSSELKYKK